MQVEDTMRVNTLVQGTLSLFVQRFCAPVLKGLIEAKRTKAQHALAAVRADLMEAQARIAEAGRLASENVGKARVSLEEQLRL